MFLNPESGDRRYDPAISVRMRKTENSSGQKPLGSFTEAAPLS
jgi:hypothetical protein